MKCYIKYEVTSVFLPPLKLAELHTCTMVAQLATKADFTKALADAGSKLVAQHGETPRPGDGRAGHLPLAPARPPAH